MCRLRCAERAAAVSAAAGRSRRGGEPGFGAVSRGSSACRFRIEHLFGYRCLHSLGAIHILCCAPETVGACL
jgi:hypothetical protein